MNTVRWRVLSDWHNTWLAAPTDQRAELRASFATEHPELLQVADALASSSGAVDGFLETPALILAARDLAQDEPPLPDGTPVGPYRIVALLARGGMGDVYRATDLRLGRDVALKTLTNAERGDGHAVERFLQEARITASLDHTNIVKVFDVGMSDGRPYLVSELLDGETLRAPIGRGRVAPADARDIACALTSGLVAAHARGLVHRDLKPENIFITKSGTAKILDFGIAKLVQDPALPRGLATLTGVVLGTAGYLAPEQVKGDPVDARTDLFALGSILFEMMTGQRAFAREHTIDTLHAIVHDDPPDLLPPGTAMTAIVRRLLAKAPDARFQSAADLLWALEQIDSNVVRATPSPASPGSRFFSVGRGWATAGAAGLAMVLVAFIGGRLREQSRSPSVAPDLTQFTWSLPAGTALDSAPIVSPIGRRIAFTAVSGGSAPRLFVWSLDSRDPKVVDGTDGAKQPFWSPDGTSLGFFARGKLMKVTVAGGVPTEICNAPDGKGGAWSPTGTIVFSPNTIFEGLARVSADGGPVQPATLVDFDRGENSHRWPVFLPDGIHFLFFVRASIDERRGVYVASLDRPASTPGSPLFRSESEAVFVPTSDRGRGVLLSAADGQLQVRPFDAAALRLDGDPRTLPVAAGANTPYHSAMLSASADSARHRGDAHAIRRAARYRRARRDGRATVRTPITKLAAPVAGRAADGPADRRSDTGQSRHLGRGPSGRQPRPRHKGRRRRRPPGVVSGWGTVGVRIRHLEGAAVEHCGGRWHWRRTGTAVSGHVLRADRLVTRRALSHRQHTADHACYWRCVERVARAGRVGQGDSLRAVPRVRRADIAGRTMAGLRVGGGWPTGRLRPRDVGSAEASRGVQRRRQPTRLAPRWARASLRRS